MSGTNNNPIMLLAKSAGIETREIGGNSAFEGGTENINFYDYDGLKINNSVKVTALEKYALLDKGLEKEGAALKAGADKSVEKALDAVDRQQSWGLMVNNLLDWIIRASFTLDYGAEPSEVSLRSHYNYKVRGGGEAVVVPGYIAIAEHLAKGQEIKLGDKVTRVALTQDGVVVTTASGKAYSGCVALVTVPVGVLQRNDITFDPPLPQAKKDAIASLKMGLEEKVVLHFAEDDWGKLPGNSEVYSGGILSQTKNDYAIFFNTMYERKANGKPNIAFFNGGNGVKSSIFTSMSDTQKKDHVLGLLGTIVAKNFPDARPLQPISFKATNWANDPFSYGSYSYTPTGVDDEVTRGAYAATVEEKLYFAGEGTSINNYQSVDGAYDTGIREAVKIADYLGLGDIKGYFSAEEGGRSSLDKLSVSLGVALGCIAFALIMGFVFMKLASRNLPEEGKMGYDPIDQQDPEAGNLRRGGSSSSRRR